MTLKTNVFNLIRKSFRFSPVENCIATLSQGRSNDSIVAKFVPGNNLYTSPSIRIVERNKIKYELDLSDYMQWMVFYGLSIEPKEALYNLVSPGSCVIDVGANVGEVSMNMAQRAGDMGRIIAFEPDPLNYKLLQKNLSLNTFKNILTIPKGLGDSNAKYAFSRNLSNSGGNRIASVNSSSIQEAFIETIKLDDFIIENNIEKVDVLKIDVEGFEYNVLKGAINVLAKFKPKLFIELNDNNLKDQGSSSEELLRLIESLSYKISNAENGQSVSSTQDFKNRHIDIIAIV